MIGVYKGVVWEVEVCLKRPKRRLQKKNQNQKRKRRLDVGLVLSQRRVKNPTRLVLV